MADPAVYRDEKGLFKRGTAGGPGRPRRTIEEDYLRTLSEAVPLEKWRQIVEMAVQHALEGDDRARTWLSKYLLGDNLPGLAKLAALDAEGVDPVEDEQERIRNRLKSKQHMQDLLQKFSDLKSV